MWVCVRVYVCVCTCVCMRVYAGVRACVFVFSRACLSVCASGGACSSVCPCASPCDPICSLCVAHSDCMQARHNQMPFRVLPGVNYWHVFVCELFIGLLR